VRVLVFARLREALGSESLALDDALLPMTVGELRRHLHRCEPPAFAEAMAEANVICALNQVVVDDAASVTPGDEVAFFPPVTGG
jgi:molybdopterin synthase sulfur carrier subunit